MKQPKYFEKAGSSFLFSKRLNSKHGIFPMFKSKLKKKLAAATVSEATIEAFELSCQLDHLQRVCLKDAHSLPVTARDMDFLQLSTFVETKTIAASKQLTYISKIDGDIKRLRQVLCSAFKRRVAGFGRYAMTNDQFSAALTNFGIKCSKADVENGLKREFLPYQVPPTERVLKLLNNLKQDNFKALDIELLLVKVDKSSLMIRLKSEQVCQFVDRVE